ncbi:MAG: hypothetical protein JWO68_61, partial [Actinomycetia bacterium]|nr:hypothetical protein [Actinomycetes bacterium]
MPLLRRPAKPSEPLTPATPYFVDGSKKG